MCKAALQLHSGLKTWVESRAKVQSLDLFEFFLNFLYKLVGDFLSFFGRFALDSTVLS
jgi:hypothetical protein